MRQTTVITRSSSLNIYLVSNNLLCTVKFGQYWRMGFLYIMVTTWLQRGQESQVVGGTVGLLSINELVNRKALDASTLNTSSTNLLTQIPTLDGKILNKLTCACACFFTWWKLYECKRPLCDDSWDKWYRVVVGTFSYWWCIGAAVVVWMHMKTTARERKDFTQKTN